MVYANVLRALRDKRGLNDHELAELSHVPESTVHRLMKGDTNNPGLEPIAAIVRVLDGDMNEVCGLNKKTSDANESIEAYKERLANMEAAIATKDRWLRWMFAYCIFLTTVTLVLLFVSE